jgi:rRNA maturation endonuclease Nob1
MAEPKAEKIEKRLEETGDPNHDGELSDADVEKVAGGVIANNDDPNTFCYCHLTAGGG